MLKDRPLLVTAMVFGGIGLVMLIVAGVLFLNGDKGPLNYIGSLLGMERGRLTTGTISQFSLVFEVMAFIIGYRALSDEM